MTLFLTEDELVELTHRRRRPAQAKTLRAMGIQHVVRADNSIAVLRAHVMRIFGENESGTVARSPRPNWDAL